MYPSHLSHILQALDKDPFLKTKAYARSELRATLPTLLRNSSFNLANLMRVSKVGAFHGMSSVNIIHGFKKTGTWPVCPAEVNVDRLLLGKGVRNAARKVELQQLATRLGPEARRDMRQPQISLAITPSRIHHCLPRAPHPPTLGQLYWVEADDGRRDVLHPLTHHVEHSRDGRQRTEVLELPFSGALLGRESARSLASKATLLTDVSRRHKSSGGKQPPGHMKKSLVLLFEVTSRFQAACFRHTAPPNVGMA